ncbi:hypothetical protein GCM10010467_04920 [Actinocorallia glomerata]|uniref:Uncharacterized protein n=2 Tax=Actinomycetes TaxID=1760 RepID=A0ABP6LZU4_9MICC
MCKLRPQVQPWRRACEVSSGGERGPETAVLRGQLGEARRRSERPVCGVAIRLDAVPGTGRDAPGARMEGSAGVECHYRRTIVEVAALPSAPYYSTPALLDGSLTGD